MSDLERTTEQGPAGGHTGAEVIDFPVPDTLPVHPEDPGLPPRARPKIRWLRLLSLAAGLGLLAAVSTVFGMMMAVAADLPKLGVFAETVNARNSELFDRTGKVKLGRLTAAEARIPVREAEVAPVMKHAIIAIEDRRFYTNPGVDIRGIGRALYQDIVQQRVVQGGSTITQQFVKNALAAQDDRTVFQKLRESAMAYHMTRKWSKEKILNAYLNTIYFGNGAYGIESAAKVYFGTQHVGCGEDGARRCAQQLEPHEAALIAGVVASPSGYDPIANPEAARARRNLVLQRMAEQGFISRVQMERSQLEGLPSQADIQAPTEDSEYPYFTTWVRQQVVDQVGAQDAFEGGLKVETTIDIKLQKMAETAVTSYLSGVGGPEATLVAIENKTGKVRAMVSGLKDYKERSFNLATQGQRQPGSSFKPFILAEALKKGYRADSTFTSKKKAFCVTRRKSGKCVEWFEVNNYEDNYAGVTTLANATTFSDNSVYAELGIKLGTKRIARLAERMGVRTDVSTNPAMTLGGLKEGVTTLDMAHAYSTFANDGKLPYGTLSPDAEDKRGTPGAVGIEKIVDGDDETRNKTKTDRRIIPYGVAQEVEAILAGVVKFGTGKQAMLGEKVLVAGKTGTTENYGDAWFVGWTKEYTVAVWVGYPDALRPMETEWRGEPVAGGTYPAAIWRAFMKQVQEALDARRLAREKKRNPDATATPGGPTDVAPAATAIPPEGGAGGEAPATPKPQTPAQQEPAREEPAQEEAAPAPETTQPTEPEEGGAAPPPGGGTEPGTQP